MSWKHSVQVRTCNFLTANRWGKPSYPHVSEPATLKLSRVCRVLVVVDCVLIVRARDLMKRDLTQTTSITSPPTTLQGHCKLAELL